MENWIKYAENSNLYIYLIEQEGKDKNLIYFFNWRQNRKCKLFNLFKKT